MWNLTLRKDFYSAQVTNELLILLSTLGFVMVNWFLYEYIKYQVSSYTMINYDKSLKVLCFSFLMLD